MDEVIRPENRHGQITVFDHALDRIFAGEMRNVGEDVAVEHREVDDALDAGLLGETEREQRLGNLVWGDGIEQKQRACLREGRLSGVEIHEVALHRGYAAREFCLFGRARQGVNLGTFLGEIGHDLRSKTPVLPVTRMVMVMLLAT